jgi:primosomal protein N' (replication factor Y) (superfamily II helicase)
MAKYCIVAASMPGRNAFLTYLNPPDLNLTQGQLVEIPLGKRHAHGVVWKFTDDVPANLAPEKLKSITKIWDQELSLSSSERQLYEWMSQYYHYSLGQLVFDCLPESLKRPRAMEITRGAGKALAHELNQEQRATFEGIKKIGLSDFRGIYLHGVTGSGKTLVYLNLMREVLASGKSVLFLLPEINLTPQFTHTFTEFLSCPIFSYHSGINNSQKYQMWKYLKENKEAVLVMGVRSCVFLPIENLGLVIVDEEHDQSFKQNDRCPYNGRDVAVKKAQIFNVPFVLGSATPAMENYFQYKMVPKEKRHYFSLPHRVAGGSFPKVIFLDVRQKEKKAKEGLNPLWPLHPTSVEMMQEALAKKEQVIVFVSRLGFANFIQCHNCGHRFTDPHTQTNLRYFKRQNILKSQHSDFQMPLPQICPECGNMQMDLKGFGTEKVQEVLQGIFPDKVIERFDRDEIKNTTDLVESLERFHQGKTDIYVGTQMLSKGHNFKRVNLVLVLGIDFQLNFPDFRAMERTNQLLTQVIGRSGRYASDSKVVVQTLNVDLPLFRHIENHSFEGALIDELRMRELSHAPPFTKMTLLILSSRFRERVVSESERLAHYLNQLNQKHQLKLEIFGPVPASIEQKHHQFSWCILLKSMAPEKMHTMLNTMEENWELTTGVSLKIDVDPYRPI